MTCRVDLLVNPTSGKGRGHPAVTVRRARKVALTSPGITAYVDGERVSMLPITCEAVPGGMRVFAPPAT